MPALDINGYSASFRTFVEFAQKTHGDGYDSASAKATLNGRQLTVSAMSLYETSAVLRKKGEKAVNDSTRELFRNAVIDMFGGLAKIPESVKKAMEMDDYGNGRPLTARRILCVKAAIDADDTMRKAGVSQFANVATRDAALAKGYLESELPRLANAVNYYVKATGASEAMALEVVSTPGTAAHRLMDYGGRFLDSAEDFADGLRLLDLFGQWYQDLVAAAGVIRDTGPTLGERNFETADTPTKLNAKSEFVYPECGQALERFVFEALAADPKADLKATSGEEMFGVANNQVTRFVCQGFGKGSWNTLAQMPVDKRGLVFRAFNTLCRLAGNAEEAKTGEGVRYFGAANAKLIVARMLKNIDALAALDAKGRLTAENLVKTCFPEMNITGRYEMRRLYDALEAVRDDAMVNLADMGVLVLAMESTGCTLAEVRAAQQNGQTLPKVPYYSEAQMTLSEVGTIDGSRAQMTADMVRPSNYAMMSDLNVNLIGEDAGVDGFGVSFQDGERFVANQSNEGRANIARIAEKIEAMCGRVHPRQASNVMAMLSQSGVNIMIQNLRAHGIKADEHSVIDFALSKDNKTGDVCIRYSSPDGLPFAFEWSAFVKPDGAVSTTPFVFLDENAKNAQDAALATAAQTIKTKLAGVRHDQAEAQGNAVDAVLREVRRDPEMLRILTMSNCNAARSIILDSQANKVRPAADIFRRLEALRRNLNELRTVAGTNRRLYEQLVDSFGRMGGKAFAPGTIPRIVESVRGVDIRPLRSISAASSPVKITEALCAFAKGLANVLAETHALDTFTGMGGPEPEVILSFDEIVMALICDRCGEDTVRGLQGAMGSRNYGKAITAFDRLFDEVLPQGIVRNPAAEPEILRTGRSLCEFGPMRLGILKIVNGSLGLPVDDNYPRNLEITQAEYRSIYNVLEKHVLAS